MLETTRRSRRPLLKKNVQSPREDCRAAVASGASVLRALIDLGETRFSSFAGSPKKPRGHGKFSNLSFAGPPKALDRNPLAGLWCRGAAASLAAGTIFARRSGGKAGESLRPAIRGCGACRCGCTRSSAVPSGAFSSRWDAWIGCYDRCVAAALRGRSRIIY